MSERTRAKAPRAGNVRPLLVIAAGASALGIAFSAANAENLGSSIAFGGVLLFIYALHRFGRTGPD